MSYLHGFDANANDAGTLLMLNGMYMQLGCGWMYDICGEDILLWLNDRQNMCSGRVVVVYVQSLILACSGTTAWISSSIEALGLHWVWVWWLTNLQRTPTYGFPQGKLHLFLFASLLLDAISFILICFLYCCLSAIFESPYGEPCVNKTSHSLWMGLRLAMTSVWIAIDMHARQHYHIF